MLGTLWIRDGIPLLDCGQVAVSAGWLLWFEPSRLAEAWPAVCSFEPAAQYRWAVRPVRASGQEIAANVLVGRKLGAGIPAESVGDWSARNDPVFTEGLGEVRRLIAEAAPGGVASQPDTAEHWYLFFRLQTACCSGAWLSATPRSGSGLQSNRRSAHACSTTRRSGPPYL